MAACLPAAEYGVGRLGGSRSCRLRGPGRDPPKRLTRTRMHSAPTPILSESPWTRALARVCVCAASWLRPRLGSASSTTAHAGCADPSTRSVEDHVAPIRRASSVVTAPAPRRRRRRGDSDPSVNLKLDAAAARYPRDEGPASYPDLWPAGKLRGKKLSGSSGPDWATKGELIRQQGERGQW
jgi:hypothetical protein